MAGGRSPYTSTTARGDNAHSHQFPRNRLESRRKIGIAPIHNVVVCEHAAVDACRSQAWHILWVHAVMNTFRWPKIAAYCDAGLKIDDPEVRFCVVPNFEGVAPDIFLSFLSCPTGIKPISLALLRKTFIVSDHPEGSNEVSGNRVVLADDKY